jgi:hypothetical protein
VLEINESKWRSRLGESHQPDTLRVTWTFPTAASEKEEKEKYQKEETSLCLCVYIVSEWGRTSAVCMFMESSHVCVRVEVLTHALREKRERERWSSDTDYISISLWLRTSCPLRSSQGSRTHRLAAACTLPASPHPERWWKLNYARTTRPCVSIKNGLRPTEFYSALICVNKFHSTLIIGHTISASLRARKVDCGLK